MIRVVYPGSGFFTHPGSRDQKAPDPGSRGQKAPDPGSRGKKAPDPGSGFATLCCGSGFGIRCYPVLLYPRIRDNFFSDPGSRIQPIFAESLVNIFWVKNT
jgi:hypothetical protein